MTERPDEIETAIDTSQSYMVWVQSVKNLDPRTWMELVDSFAPRLRDDIRASLKTRQMSLDLADDIEQDTWTTAIRRINVFVWVDEDRFQHWLHVIALNHIRTYRRKQGRHSSLDDYEDSEMERKLDQFFETFLWNEATIEDEVILRERLQALDRVMQVLRPVEREIVIRRTMGETPRELAREYGRTPRDISMLVWRARKKIEAEFGQSDWEDDPDE